MPDDKQINFEEKLQALGYTLPVPPKPVAAYVPGVRTGNLIYTSGQLPMQEGRLEYAGKVGQDLSPEQAYEGARICVLNCLSVIKDLAGGLEKIERVVKLTGFVNSAAGFTGQPQVVNGASELLVELLGEKGKHARAAVGSNELPLNAAVEVEMIVEVRE